jgi:S-methylmethionine-dependent homocysteine/selenocysteine methylase
MSDGAAPPSTLVESLRARIDGGEVIILDGGMGTALDAGGIQMDHELWAAIASLEAPDRVRAAHRSFIDAGAEVIITNTFNAGRPRLAAAGREDDLRRAIENAVQVAGQARGAADRPIAIGGSISSSSASAKEHDRDVLDHDAAYRAYAEQAELLAEQGVDFLALEMFETPDRGRPAVEAAVATGLPVWLGLSCRLSPGGQLLAGAEDYGAGRGSFTELADEVLDDRIWAVNVMHSRLDAVIPALDVLAARWNGPLGAYPHHGTYDRQKQTWRFAALEPDQLVAAAQEWVARGAQLVGGCCGTGPAHIQAIAASLPRAARLGESVPP